MHRAMPDDRSSSVGIWEIMGYHGTTWASMQQAWQPRTRGFAGRQLLINDART
jgi:hypothetical protein